jgi:hypothetical protein
VSTAQVVIVCIATLLALGIAAFVAICALETKSGVARDDREAATAADHLGSAVAGNIAAAVAALEQLTDALEQSGALLARGPSLVGKSLVVHTRKPDDQSIRGAVAAHYADRLVLRDAAYLHGSGAQDAGGLVDVLLINVSSWQELQAPTESAAA